MKRCYPGTSVTVDATPGHTVSGVSASVMKDLIRCGGDVLSLMILNQLQVITHKKLVFSQYNIINLSIADGVLPNCRSTKDCWKYDINLVCGEDKKCKCRQDMKWNKKQLEYQAVLQHVIILSNYFPL